ncbi:hypothetical protein [Falsiroseomonas sp.]|uniref:hypothetical protein n=1 Tax=Falsiroseomonas sp. TaxID=2870721 RepID=UPI003564E0DF
MWLGAAAVLVVGVVALAGLGGPPPQRPAGAGLPPAALERPSFTVAEQVAPGSAIAAEEARIAALRATRARLEQEIAGLRIEAEERRRNMPGRKELTGDQATGAGPPLAAADRGGALSTTAALAAQTAAPELPDRSLRVFVHHRANSRPGAEAAEQLAQSLRTAGVDISAVRPAPFVPSTPVVRYFHDEDQAAAARLAGRLGSGWAIQDFRAYLPQPPPRTLEVWLPAN